MDIHKNARLTLHGRERLAKMILSGQTPEAASEAAGVCPRTGRKSVLNRFGECPIKCVRALHGGLIVIG